MRIILVATQQPALLLALQSLARQYGAIVVEPQNFATLASDAIAIVIDLWCLPEAEWRTYLDYLQELHGEDSTPFIVLSPQHAESQAMDMPMHISSKPTGSLHLCIDTEVGKIYSIVEEALLGTRNQWNNHKPSATAPNQFDVEACYIATCFPEDYVVVVSRPDNTASFTHYRQVAEWAHIDEDQLAAAPFLVFPFLTEEEARGFSTTVPEGMATLYSQGKCIGSN